MNGPRWEIIAWHKTERVVRMFVAAEVTGREQSHTISAVASKSRRITAKIVSSLFIAKQIHIFGGGRFGATEHCKQRLDLTGYVHSLLITSRSVCVRQLGTSIS